MLGETKNQFSLTRAALSSSGRAKSDFLSVSLTKTRRLCFSSLGLGLVLIADGCTKSWQIPDPPAWFKQVPPKPEWWSSGMAGPSSSLESDGYEQIKVFQDRIADKVRNGISPLQERRQFIRYLDRLSSSRRFTPAERRRFRLEAVDTYSRLGEHRRAAWEYARIANEDTNDWVALQGLAREYELAGEEKQALGIYLFMEGRLKDSVVNNVYRPIIAPNITRLKGVARDCPLKKPDWWERFKHPPTSLADTPSSFQFSNFGDGLAVVGVLAKGPDEKKMIRAAIALTEVKPMTILEQEWALMRLALAYSTIGDHHRAIVSAWSIPEHFSYDGEECAKAIRFIAKEFEKLGESDRAEDILNQLPCFGIERPSDSGNRPDGALAR